MAEGIAAELSRRVGDLSHRLFGNDEGNSGTPVLKETSIGEEPPAADLPSGWNEAKAADGRVYYYTSDGRTQWKRPTQAAGSAPADATTATPNSGSPPAAPVSSLEPSVPNVLSSVTRTESSAEEAGIAVQLSRSIGEISSRLFGNGQHPKLQSSTVGDITAERTILDEHVASAPVPAPNDAQKTVPAGKGSTPEDAPSATGAGGASAAAGAATSGEGVQAAAAPSSPASPPPQKKLVDPERRRQVARAMWRSAVLRVAAQQVAEEMNTKLDMLASKDKLPQAAAKAKPKRRSITASVGGALKGVGKQFASAFDDTLAVAGSYVIMGLEGTPPTPTIPSTLEGDSAVDRIARAEAEKVFQQAVLARAELNVAKGVAAFAQAKRLNAKAAQEGKGVLDA
uniref:WW domain-containing protein n=1 Tax=Haptolina brevifila TaxID=156173 RepID=A0A7S2MZ64_9EUKA|mmetsp:Transcript_62643/g.123741  ORF Transcript_62643/g.123741 Transcript_62643/m.123741 type:complete len:398 (+) Transcript_62643:29-1222(+)